MKKRALLLVDVQNDFLPGGALAISEAERIIPIINAIIPLFDLVLATKDWHPAQHISFASKHGKSPGDVVEIEGVRQELWPDHCIQGTWGAEFAPTLNTEKIEKVFYKGTDPLIDSYSAFYDNAHKRETGLAEYLKKAGVEEIYFAGLATDYCVKYSALDAAFIGLKTHVVINACQGIDLPSGSIKNAICEMQTAGVHFIQIEK